MVVCPAGFTADHLEILYDLDIECAAVAHRLGLLWRRTESLNADPGLLGELWLRASIARHATERAFELSDDELVRALSAELRQLIGPLICGGPLEVVDRHVMRWRACLPVYQPGHLERLDALEREIRRLPAVELAGAAYRGVGVPRCIQQALGAARRLLAAFGGPPADSPAAGPAPERNRHDNEQDGGLRCRTRSII